MTGKREIHPEEVELSKVMNEIDKKYGKGITSYASQAKGLNITRISTGSFGLDIETGGGIPENKVTTIVGPYEAGKTTLALKTIKAAQTKYPNRKTVWIDAEGALDLAWTKKQGVDMDNLILVKPQYAEQAFDIILNMVRVPDISAIVLDSVAALVPSREAEDSMEDWSIGLNAYLNSKFLRKLSSALWTGKTLNEKGNGCSIILLNQLRVKVGGYGAGKDIMPGGKALDFYSSLRVDLMPGEWKTGEIRGRDEVVGREIRFKTEKNRTFPAKKKGSFDLYTQDTGSIKAGQIDRLKEVITYGVIWDVIVRKGAWFHLGDEMKFHGNTQLIRYLEENPDNLADIERRILQKIDEEQEEKEVLVDPEGNLIEA